ncbi:glycosyltransferase family 4 protein [Patulibacter brassicae]|uniref:Glycosyltransferase family 4 protein n=1 Tax=Patulibacter brassicae TaxID=1705717 RepID=A0ABU4VFW2_9ACTN|nr:glycosyltransferase family 4 protein [Patulibacter brassicae]MDX8150019.1 glycosyltransferase family 4 protein [Patulibacter brassicae]
MSAPAAPRVLAITNLYPPHHLGGYELVHAGADEHLAGTGWAVHVLTTDHREAGAPADPRPSAPGGPGTVSVARALPWYWQDHAFPRRSAREVLALERRAHAALDAALAAHRPDVVALWAMGGLSTSLLGTLARRGVPVVSVVHDLWPRYVHRVDPFARRLRPLGPLAGPVARRLGSDAGPRPAPVARAAGGAGPTATARRTAAALRRRVRGELPVLPPGPVLLNSRRLGNELLGAEDAPWPSGWRVVAPGVALPDAPPPERAWTGALLCLGRLDERKGVDLAVAALAQLPGHRLTVAGGGDDRVAAGLRAQAAALGIDDRVTLLGAVGRERVAALLAAHDAVLFPVRWSEPFGLVPLEAMAHGRPVVATGGGGQDEYLRDGANALVVPHEDPAAIAAAVRRLAGDPDLRARLRRGGRETAAGLDERAFRETVAGVLADAAAGGRGA